MDVDKILSRLSLSCVGVHFKVICSQDKIYENGRKYLQVIYQAPCTKTGKSGVWTGRKWYLSEFMTEDEVVKTAFAAFHAAVSHEVMEGFKVDGKILFNPHVNFEELLKISEKEISRL